MNDGRNPLYRLTDEEVDEHLTIFASMINGLSDLDLFANLAQYELLYAKGKLDNIEVSERDLIWAEWKTR